MQRAGSIEDVLCQRTVKGETDSGRGMEAEEVAKIIWSY